MTDPQLPPTAPHGSVPPIPSPTPPYGATPSQAAPSYRGQQSYQAPPGAYTAPVGGYTASSSGDYQAPAPTQPRSAVMGIVAFVLSLAAAIVAPIVAGIAGYQIGFQLPTVTEYIDSTTSDFSFLSPVRDQVLIGEIGFWAGTLGGVVAIVLGIVAIVNRAGRMWGIVGLILAVLGPVIFVVVLGVTLGAGAGAGVSLSGS